MLEQKKCKECGKLFTPKNARQQYCADIHYRPCPVCGKLVEIKYLSDPTPRCTDCRKRRVKSEVSKIVNNFVENVDNSSDDYEVKMYTGRDGSCGFHTKHNYLVRVRPNTPYGYLVEAIQDLTVQEDVDIQLPMASMNSYAYFFKEVKQ